jgi:hypothetical protein
VDAAQKATLKGNIQGNATVISFNGVNLAINAVFNGTPLSGGDALIIANWYNQAASPDYLGWAVVDKSAIDALIDKSTYTPTDAAPASGATAQATNDALLFQNRAIVGQLKQANAQWLTAGAGRLDARVASLRKNFQDCMRQIPMGAAGASLDAGWGAAASPGVVRTGMMRKLTNLEVVFAVVGSGAGNQGADPRGSATNPDVYVVSQVLTANDIQDLK